MTSILVRNAQPADFTRIVQLNEKEVHYTSKMDLGRLRLLDQIVAYHKVAAVEGQIAGFMFAMRDGANYANDNFNWFSSRLINFIYIDRIVVDPIFSGRKIGSTMYRDLFDFAHSHGFQHIVCEYNVDPPNPVSQAFHDKWGFKEMGTQWLDGGAKRVSLQIAKINTSNR